MKFSNSRPYSNFVCFSLVSFVLSACASNDASHLPSIFALPGAVISSSIENATYNARRKKVESYVTHHFLAIRNDIRRGGGSALDEVLDVAGLKGKKRESAKSELIKSQEHLFHHLDSVTDNLMHDFASLYPVKQADKKMNGLTYTEAHNIIRSFADTHFEALRIAIQQGDGEALDQLAIRLNITDPEKNARFKQKAKLLYKTIYLDLLIVSLMVYQ